MGLFGKKEQAFTPIGVKVLFYEGNLPGFALNEACIITIGSDVVEFTQHKTKTTATIERSRILGLDILTQTQFMEQYKGHQKIDKGAKRTYYIFNYMNKNGETESLIFWLFNIDNHVLTMIKVRKELLKGKSAQTYEL